MPRSFSDVIRDDQTSEDQDGTELPDLEAARNEAVRCAGEMIRARSLTAVPELWAMVVRDDRRQVLAKPSFVVSDSGTA